MENIEVQHTAPAAKPLAAIVAAILKGLVGAMFIVSAVAKIVTIDIFEMYVYSCGLFPMGVSFVLSRLVIGAEALLGVALVSNRHHRFTTLTTLLFLICFIIFLSYAHLVGRSDSCHCFGELMPFTPVQSILKNAVLIAIMLYVYKFAPREWSPRWWMALLMHLAIAAATVLFTWNALYTVDLLALVMLLVLMCVGVLASLPCYSRWYITAILVLTPIVTVFILSPPDNWIASEDNNRYDKALLETEVLQQSELQNGRHLVAFFSPTCGYCRLAAEKIATMTKRKEIDKEQIVYIFPQVSKPESYDRFYEAALSERFNEQRIDKELFIRITRAAFPVVLLADEGTVAASLSYRNIDEETVCRFLSGGDENK